jgi:hypothetical protein
MRLHAKESIMLDRGSFLIGAGALLTASLVTKSKAFSRDTGKPLDRTPEQIADQAEHDAALAAHKDEINKLMIILRAEEDAKRAVGIK